MAEETKQQIELTSTKLADEKVEPLRQQNRLLNDMVMSFGQIHLRRNELQDELSNLEEQLANVESQYKEETKKMRELVSELEKEYPRGQIDLNEGVVTYRADFKEAAEAAEAAKASE
jgi:hypothetical protein